MQVPQCAHISSSKNRISYYTTWVGLGCRVYCPPLPLLPHLNVIAKRGNCPCARIPYLILLNMVAKKFVARHAINNASRHNSITDKSTSSEDTPAQTPEQITRYQLTNTTIGQHFLGHTCTRPADHYQHVYQFSTILSSRGSGQLIGPPRPTLWRNSRPP